VYFRAVVLLRRTRNRLAFALLLGAFVLATPAGAAAAPTGARARASASPKPSEVALTPQLVAAPGLPVSMAPVGLSIEYPAMAADLGGEACPPPALAAELLRLGSPPIELAGVSQDETAPSGALPGPPGSWQAATLYQLPTQFWSQLHCLLAAAKDPLTVGLNLRTGSLAWAAQMVAGAQSAATAGLAFSLGNEPDLYRIPNYASLDKPMPGQEAAEAGLYLQLAGYLRPAIGPEALVGPELSRPANWRAQLPRIIAELHEQTVGVHLYPLTDCTSPRAVTLGGLLSNRVADSPARLAWVVADARAAGVPAIISEANSASCGGLGGVSDTPAAAVWAVRFVLSALKTGFGEVRFHFSGDPYDAFLVRGGAIVPRPLESALFALDQWLPVGSTLRTVAGVHGLLATAVAPPPGAAQPGAPGAAAPPGGAAQPGSPSAPAVTLILDNQSASARPLLLRGAKSVHVALLSAARAGLQTRTELATHGRVRITVPANGVLAVSSAS
jgi:hypothetical protein